MKKATVKKITLTRETLGTLNDQEMKAILGGERPVTGDSKNVCCA